MASSLESDENISVAVINYSDEKTTLEGGGWGLFQLTVRDYGDVKAGIPKVYPSRPQWRAERERT